MKMNKICYWVVIYGFMFALEACRESTPEFTVTGIVAGADGQTMYMENIGLSDIRLIDSVKLNSSLAPEEPVDQLRHRLYRDRHLYSRC